MAPNNKPLGITDVVLRDAHQSLLATRLRIDDMLPICDQLDRIGYWSLETWGVVDRLSQTAQNELINTVTIFLGLSVGAKLNAEAFLQLETLGIGIK